MTVKELMDLLKNEDPNKLVVLQSDDEGNSYEKVRGIDSDNTGFLEQGYREGEIHIMELTKEYIELGYTKEDLRDNVTPCVVIYP